MRLKNTPAPSYIDLSDEIGRSSSTRSKAGKKAKTKGASFERRMAKSLGEWWEVKFYRTPQSGGSHLKEGYELAGDITTPDEAFRFHVECKNQESWTLHGMMTSPKSLVWKWWEQTLGDCPEDRQPLLVFTRNHLPVFVLMERDLWNSLPPLEAPSENLESKVVINMDNVVVITLERFLSIPKEDFVWLFESLKEIGNE